MLMSVHNRLVGCPYLTRLKSYKRVAKVCVFFIDFSNIF